MQHQLLGKLSRVNILYLQDGGLPCRSGELEPGKHAVMNNWMENDIATPSAGEIALRVLQSAAARRTKAGAAISSVHRRLAGQLCF